jgi:type I restriction enzyme M protein
VDEQLNCNKASLDIFWLRDESLEDSDNLPDPDVLAQEIVEDLEAALEQFREIAADLGTTERTTKEIKGTDDE